MPSEPFLHCRLMACICSSAYNVFSGLFPLPDARPYDSLFSRVGFCLITVTLFTATSILNLKCMSSVFSRLIFTAANITSTLKLESSSFVFSGFIFTAANMSNLFNQQPVSPLLACFTLTSAGTSLSFGFQSFLCYSKRDISSSSIPNDEVIGCLHQAWRV